MAIKRLYDTLVGATARVNQLAHNFIERSNILGVTIIPDNTNGSITITGTATASNNLYFTNSFPVLADHKYFLRGSKGDGRLGLEGSSLKDSGNGIIYSTATSNTASFLYWFNEGDVLDETLYPQFIDLTAMFGSTIADYIYSLETATAGAGVAKLREWGFFTGEYIPYNPGTLESVEARSHVMRGFNQWDEEWESGYYDIADGLEKASSSWARNKELISVVPNTGYTFKANTSESVGGIGYILFYDGNKQYLNSYVQMLSTLYGATGQQFTVPSNACYISFYMNVAWQSIGICINLSSSRNGEYEPYHEYSYDLGTDTLRGIFKLDASNNLYADGDRKTADGTITRKYGIRAYQSGDESLPDAITDGTTTVYKLTTPTTEQGDPFPSPQVCYPDGTEEYVTGNGVPVGHETRYQL